MLDALLKGPAAYAPRTGWPAWSVIPAAVLILVLAALIGALLAWGYSSLAGLGLPQVAENGVLPPQVMVQLTIWTAGLQIAIILLTLLAAGFFSSARAEVLALRRPSQGWRVLPLALVPLFVVTMAWTGMLMLVKPEAVLHDLRPFQEILHSNAFWLMLIVIGIGAPLSEELLFRGFLFSGLAQSRLGFLGAGILTSLLWATLHYGYSIFGLIEVLGIGLYFAWLLVHTGSLWVSMFCHAVYNSVMALGIYFMTLPAAS
jgi:membrane protease YdiL (CAAX protease family)